MSPRLRRSDKLALILLGIILVLLAFGVLGGRYGPGGASSGPAAGGTWVSGLDLPPTLPPATVPPAHEGQPTFTAGAPAAGPESDPSDTAGPERVGILAGHWQFDSGAVCADGLREVDVTLNIATRVRNILETQGVVAEILPEHDPRLPQAPLLGYRGRALVALHADVCDLPGFSGFKVARGTYSSTPVADDRLVACLNREYAAATGLPEHRDTISIDMTNYYVFREIHPETPAAIVELGFLSDDRATLVDRAFEVASGVANGLRCFLDGG